MKLYRKCIAVVLCAGLLLVLYVTLTFHRYGRMLDRQKELGHLFMRSLTEQELTAWIHWADDQMIQFEQNYKENHIYIDGDKMPKELADLGLLRLYVSTDMLALTWVGGMGNTSLHFRRESDGKIHVVAWYTDEHSEDLGRHDVAQKSPINSGK